MCYNITLQKIPADADVPVKEKILEENKMFKKLKNKKGFTLVELIVVLVILAILAALLVPALTGYIDKAREQSLISQGSMVLTAAQATVSESYGNGDVIINDAGKVVLKSTLTAESDGYKAIQNQINQLAEVKEGASWAFTVKIDDKDATYKAVKIDTLTYSDGTNAITYTNGSWGSTQKKTTTATVTDSLISGNVPKPKKNGNG